MRPVSLAPLLSASLATLHAAQLPVPQLAQVRTWGGLLATHAVTVWMPGNKSASFHIGIDRTSCKPGGSVVLYCLESPADTDYPPGDLGPFDVNIATPATTRGGGAREQLQKEMRALAKSGVPSFYMKTIPMSEVGDIKIELRNGYRNEAVASVTVKVSGNREAPWLPWQHVENEPAVEANTPDAPGNDESDTMDVANPRAGQAMPQWDGEEPILLEKIPGPKLALPMLLLPAPDPGVHLGIQGRELVVTMAEKTPFYNLDERFLTRWWVNGKPFMPEPEALAAESSTWDGPANVLRQARFRMEFRPDALGAEKGDTIGVQLLLCHTGWEYTGPAQQAALAAEPPGDKVAAESIHIAQPTNRVEFTYSGDPKNFVQQK